METVITFDKGISWHKIDSKMIKGDTTCKDKICNLQIHGRFSISKHVHVPKTVVSSKAAPGLVIAHGNLGDALASSNVDVFVSKDGGYHWKKSLTGQHEYQILDHGNIIAAIESSTSQDRNIDSIKLSFDQGDCWIEYKFAEEKIEYWVYFKKNT